jgi:nitrite reductase (NADH) small subunit
VSAELQVQPVQQGEWQALCGLADLVPQSGVVAWLDDTQVALFYLPGHTPALYALANRDPQSGANVIGRGIIGQLKDELVVASPLYKQHFNLLTGQCLEDPGQALQTWPVRLRGETVEIQRA